MNNPKLFYINHHDDNLRTINPCCCVMKPDKVMDYFCVLEIENLSTRDVPGIEMSKKDLIHVLCQLAI